MYDPTQYDPSQVYGAPTAMGAQSPYGYAPVNTQQSTASPMVQQLNPQQPTQQQKLAMALMQQNGQGQQGGMGGQNPQGQTSSLAFLGQLAKMYMSTGGGD